MTTTFRIDASELNGSFLQKLQSLFEDKKLVITVEEEMDETEYLLSTKENRMMFQESIQQAKEGKIISLNVQDLERSIIN